MGLFANQDIAAGQELSYDYMFEHAGQSPDAYRYVLMQGFAVAPNKRSE